MSLLKKFKKSAKELTNDTRNTIVGLGILAAMLLASAKDADAQYIRMDSKTPSSPNPDEWFAPSIGLRGMYAWTDNDYQGAFPAFNMSTMIQDGIKDELNLNFQFSVDMNYGFTKYSGMYGGLYSDHTTSLARHNNGRNREWDHSAGIEAGAYIYLWEKLRVEGKYYKPLAESKNVRNGEMLGVSLNLLLK